MWSEEHAVKVQSYTARKKPSVWAATFVHTLLPGWKCVCSYFKVSSVFTCSKYKSSCQTLKCCVVSHIEPISATLSITNPSTLAAPTFTRFHTAASQVSQIPDRVNSLLNLSSVVTLPPSSLPVKSHCVIQYRRDWACGQKGRGMGGNSAPCCLPCQKKFGLIHIKTALRNTLVPQ